MTMRARKVSLWLGNLGMVVLACLVVVDVVGAQGKVSFIAPRAFPACLAAVSIAVGDFNGDDHPDLATACDFSGFVAILLRQGDGTFEAAPEFGVGAGLPVSVVAGDFNGDGRLDLATANPFDVGVYKEQGKLCGHSWAALRGEPVGERIRPDVFTLIYSYPAAADCSPGDRPKEAGGAPHTLLGKQPWQEPKLTFVEAKLTKHGKLEEVTAGFFGGVTP
jgi:hypothetical protein